MLILLRLAKVPLCLLIGISALFGYLYGQPHSWLEGLSVAFSVFLLAAGGATFNSIQERTIDGRMERTSLRPLVTGEVSLPAAFIIGILFATAGLILLWSISSVFSAVLGVLALFLYNMVYTPLKPLSIWALVPGAVCGALPPVIGLSCTAIPIFSFAGLLIFSMMVLWQVPHFWLVILAHRKDYVEGEIVNFFNYFTEYQLKKLFVTWIGALAVVMLLYAAIPDNLNNVARFFILLNAILLVGTFVRLPTSWTNNGAKRLFRALNLFLLLHMFGVIWGRMFL